MRELFARSEQASENRLVTAYSPDAAATVHLGDRLLLLSQIPRGAARLIVTSPPYNIGKEYETVVELEKYLRGQEETIAASVDALAEDGHLCWQVGNHVDKKGEIFPIDTLLYPLFKKLGLRMRNRIVWHFGHGLHCTRRFSGRYEVIAWFSKSDRYVFNLDEVRVPNKYPGKKHYKGPKVGQYSCNPLGKNPSDVWEIPNVKNNHPEKTSHPCQFPIELIERLVLALTNPHDLVIDPYMGVGTALCAAVLHGRRGAGADTCEEYVEMAKNRLHQAFDGSLKRRPLGKPVYQPGPNCKIAQLPDELARQNTSHQQTKLWKGVSK